MTSLAKPAKILAPCSECTGSVMMSNCWCSQVGAFAPSSMTRSGIMVPLMIATPTECIQECAWVTPRIITRSVPIQEWNIVSERYTYSNSKIRLPLTPLWTLLMSHVQPFLESVWFDVLSLENRLVINSTQLMLVHFFIWDQIWIRDQFFFEKSTRGIVTVTEHVYVRTLQLVRYMAYRNTYGGNVYKDLCRAPSFA